MLIRWSQQCLMGYVDPITTSISKYFVKSHLTSYSNFVLFSSDCVKFHLITDICEYRPPFKDFRCHYGYHFTSMMGYKVENSISRFPLPLVWSQFPLIKCKLPFQNFRCHYGHYPTLMGYDVQTSISRFLLRPLFYLNGKWRHFPCKDW